LFLRVTSEIFGLWFKDAVKVVNLRLQI